MLLLYEHLNVSFERVRRKITCTLDDDIRCTAHVGFAVTVVCNLGSDQADDPSHPPQLQLQGIQLVKHLQKLNDSQKQRAEVLISLKRFDEAEDLYHKMGRQDLAIEMRSKLGEQLHG